MVESCKKIRLLFTFYFFQQLDYFQLLSVIESIQLFAQDLYLAKDNWGYLPFQSLIVTSVTSSGKSVSFSCFACCSHPFLNLETNAIAFFHYYFPILLPFHFHLPIGKGDSNWIFKFVSVKSYIPKCWNHSIWLQRNNLIFCKCFLSQVFFFKYKIIQ